MCRMLELTTKIVRFVVKLPKQAPTCMLFWLQEIVSLPDCSSQILFSLINIVWNIMRVDCQKNKNKI